MLDLTYEENDAVARLLSRTIDDDCYRLSPRIRNLAAILNKVGPEPAREPEAAAACKPRSSRIDPPPLGLIRRRVGSGRRGRAMQLPRMLSALLCSRD